jgi:flagellar basal body-associated protein FliL
MPVQQEEVNHKSGSPATNRRTAWVIVIIMTVLLVLALLGTVWGFLRQAHVFMAGKGQAKGETAAPVSPAAAVVTLAPGARIVSATTEAGKLVLHVETVSGGEVEIIDLATGKLTGQVKTQKP